MVAIRGVATNGTLYIAAASNGIWTSTTLQAWQRVSLPANASYLYDDVIWDGNQFIAVGFGIVTSPDGSNWTVRVAPNSTDEWYSIAHANGAYIAVGLDGTRVLYSADSIAWTSQATGLHPAGGGDSYELSGIGSNGTDFVADGEHYPSVGASSSDVVLTSPDGKTWTQATLPAAGLYTQPRLNNVAWGAGVYVVGGSFGIYTSNDGTNWTAHALIDQSNPSAPVRFVFGRIQWLNNRFVAAGFSQSVNGRFIATFESTDGITWQRQDLEPKGASFFYDFGALAFNGSDYIAAGYLGIYESSDASSWSKVFTGPQFNLSDCVIAGSGKFVVPGTAGNLTSSDGKTWPDALQPNSGSISPGGRGGQGCGVFAQGAFYTVSGTDGSVDQAPDGVTYTIVGNTTFTLASAITWDGTNFTALDSAGTILGAFDTSSDGTNWTHLSVSGFTAPFTTQSLQFGSNGGARLRFAGQRYFVWGSTSLGPFLYTSTDRVNWSVFPLTLSSDTQIGAVAFAKGIYVVVGSSSTSGASLVYTSTDGTSWKQVTGLPSGYHFSWNDMIADGNGFLAVGLAAELGAAVMTSTDGNTWSLQLIPNVAALNSVTTNGTQYVAASFYDIVSAPVPSSNTGGGSTGGSNGGGSKGGGGSLDILALTLFSGLALRRRERWMRD